MKVFIVGGNYQISKMFDQEGWDIANSPSEADFVQFTGGEDVSPFLYGEEQHPLTYPSGIRDSMEQEAFQEAQILGINCLGICRGAQFLNVMNGGKLYQHVGNHALRGTHDCYSEVMGKTVKVSSTHHQMMRPSETGELEGWAWKLSHFKEHMLDKDTIARRVTDEKDVEVVFYEDTKSLCFQPHPEYGYAGETRDYYFTLLNHYFK